MFACSSHSRVPTLRTSADAFSASELRHSKVKPRFCLNAVKRESSKKRGDAEQNCFICRKKYVRLRRGDLLYLSDIKDSASPIAAPIPIPQRNLFLFMERKASAQLLSISAQFFL